MVGGWAASQRVRLWVWFTGLVVQPPWPLGMAANQRLLKLANLTSSSCSLVNLPQLPCVFSYVSHVYWCLLVLCFLFSHCSVHVSCPAYIPQ